MKAIRLSVFGTIIVAFCQLTFAAERNAAAELALHSEPSIGSAMGIWNEGKLYPVEQLDGLKVAIVPGRAYSRAPVGEVTITGLEELKKAASEGDGIAEHVLARFHLEGRQGLSKDKVEAYKWAALAALQGQKISASLVRELTLFMMPDEIVRARQAVVIHISRRLEQL